MDADDRALCKADFDRSSWACVRLADGSEWTGAYHDEARDAARADGNFSPQVESGFRTRDGRFLSRRAMHALLHAWGCRREASGTAFAEDLVDHTGRVFPEW